MPIPPLFFLHNCPIIYSIVLLQNNYFPKAQTWNAILDQNWYKENLVGSRLFRFNLTSFLSFTNIGNCFRNLFPILSNKQTQIDQSYL